MMGFCCKIMSLPLWIKGVIVTAMTFLISWIAVYDLMSVSFFAPMEKAADFRFSDFYTLVANDRAVKNLHPSVVVVAVDRCNRREIAATIEDVDFCNPAAIGLDIAFSTPRDTVDDPLASAIASCPRLVMPVVAEETGDGTYTAVHTSYYDRFAPGDATFAAVNIEGDKEARFTVREFMPSFPAQGGGYIPSLTLALIEKAAPDIAAKVKARGGKSESLRFASYEFETIYPDEILEYPELIEGKIVIIGKVNDAGDLHSTPLDNFTPGAIIHAHSAATMLDGDFTRRLSAVESWLIAAAACYLVVLISLLLAESTLGDITVRCIQIAALYLMITCGALVYIRFNIDLDFTGAMLMTSLGVVACDIFNGIFADDGIIAMCITKINRLITITTDIRNEIYAKCSFKNLFRNSADDDSDVTIS